MITRETLCFFCTRFEIIAMEYITWLRVLQSGYINKERYVFGW